MGEKYSKQLNCGGATGCAAAVFQKNAKTAEILKKTVLLIIRFIVQLKVGFNHYYKVGFIRAYNGLYII